MNLPEKHIVYLSLGSNLGDRDAILDCAIEQISLESEVEAISPRYETPAWGYDSDQFFLNLCLKVKTTDTPESFLVKMKRIEVEAGRKKHAESGYQDRTLDIDLIFFDQLVMHTESLQLPHPKMAERLFVLVPLNDLAPDFKHPEFYTNTTDLLKKCTDQSCIIAHKTKQIIDN